VRQLTDNDHYDWMPSWSPDGDHIAFASDRDGDWEIYVINADGTDLRQITDNDHGDWDPSWSPDGDHIAFTGRRGGPHMEIFVMEDDGTNTYSTGQQGFHPSFGG